MCYDNLRNNFVIEITMKYLPIGCALRLIEKQVKVLRCPAAVMQSRPHSVTGKLGRRGRRGSRARRTARLGRCIVPARDRKARLLLCVSYAFLPGEQEGFLFVQHDNPSLYWSRYAESF